MNVASTPPAMPTGEPHHHDDTPASLAELQADVIVVDYQAEYQADLQERCPQT